MDKAAAKRRRKAKEEDKKGDGESMDKDPFSKKSKRAESKKRKASALLAVSELNDAEKAAAKRRRKAKEGGEEEEEEKEEKEGDGENNSVKELVTMERPRISDKPLLEGLEYEELRRRLRERKRALSCLPEFRLKAVGEAATVAREGRVPLFMSDLQHLLTFSLVGDRAPYWPHRWATLAKWNRLSNLVVLVVEGLGLPAADKPWIPNMPLLEVVAPASYGSSVAEELALLPLTVRHKKKLIEEFGSLENSLEQGEAFKAFRSIFPVKVAEASTSPSPSATPSDAMKVRLLLSASQMVTESYPLPLAGVMAERYRAFVPTCPTYTEVSPSSPLYSVDCEMVLTEAGSELARICVVDSSLQVLYHTLVQPSQPVRNFLTRYSGITPDMLEGVTTSLAEVQAALQALLPTDAILVGQSLNCDLVAMQMMHPYVIDTSICYNITGDRRRKSKLSVLAHLFLNMRIQTQGKAGHSPIEDAQTAMKLVNLKLEKGLAFGDVVLGGQVPVMDEGGVYTVPSAGGKEAKHENLMISLTKTLAEREKTVALVTDRSADQGYRDLEGFRRDLKTSSSQESVDSAVSAACTAAVEHNLTICHVDVSEEGEPEAVARAAAATLHGFTSVNGMFVLLLAGTPAASAVAGVLVRKPSQDHL